MHVSAQSSQAPHLPPSPPSSANAAELTSLHQVPLPQPLSAQPGCDGTLLPLQTAQASSHCLRLPVMGGRCPSPGCTGQLGRPGPAVGRGKCSPHLSRTEIDVFRARRELGLLVPQHQGSAVGFD